MDKVNDLMNAFNSAAADYDKNRRALIPCFNDFYGTAVKIINPANVYPSVLDIGAGTGLMTAFMMEKFPGAVFTLIDISGDMLEIAKRRFSGSENVKYISGDYCKIFFSQKFDIIISSLSIHHLGDIEKQNLFKKIFDCLNDDGIFVNADQFIAESDELEKLYRKIWYAKIEESDLNQLEKSAAYERMKLDRLSKAGESSDWLKQAGFADVELIYKYLMFGVFYCKKSRG
jgi:tRNA (cmo5U34)-methyltransferase